MREIWERQLEQFHKALKPHVQTYADGFQGIDPTTAPEQLVEAYSRHLSIGYAHGWITT